MEMLNCAPLPASVLTPLPPPPTPQVTYNVTGFIEKNNDLLFRDLSQAMWAARHPLLRSLFPEGDPQKVSLKLPPTAGFQFKTSVAMLMKNLYSKNPNYIRYGPGRDPQGGVGVALAPVRPHPKPPLPSAGASNPTTPSQRWCSRRSWCWDRSGTWG